MHFYLILGWKESLEKYLASSNYLTHANCDGQTIAYTPFTVTKLLPLVS